MLRNLADAWGWIQQIVRRIERLESGAQLGNSSITSGRMRFIGGTLRVDSGGRVEIEGTLVGAGGFTWTGPFRLEGPWTFTGAGTITGNVTATGKWTQNGEWTFNGNGTIAGDVTSTGEWTQNGDWEFNGDGEITGDVRLTGDLVVTGNGRVKVGTAMTLTPARDGGSVDFSNGAFLSSNASSIGLTKDNNTVRIGDDLASLVAGARSFTVRPTGYQMPSVPQATSVDGLSWLAVNAAGFIFQVAPGIGGPGSGDFDWPFSLATVTSEFGMRTHPITGVPTMHEGIDFGVPAGTPIPAAGRGTVLATGFDSGRGNYVVLSHSGGIETHYFHMATAPVVSAGQSVAKGQTLGPVGSTGSSTAAHLHWETHVDGSAINPRDFMADHDYDGN